MDLHHSFSYNKHYGFGHNAATCQYQLLSKIYPYLSDENKINSNDYKNILCARNTTYITAKLLNFAVYFG